MGWQGSSFYFPETSLNVGIFTRHFPFLLHLLGWTKANNITDNLKIYMCDMSFSSLLWNFPVIIVILLEIMLNLPFKLNDLSESVCGVFSVVMLWSYQIVNARFFDARVVAILFYDKILNRGEKFLPFFPIYKFVTSHKI